MIPSGHTAVMPNKASAKAVEADADPVRQLHHRLNYFPTPPWATRALLEQVIPDAKGTAWEPACGEGHMAKVLEERFDSVYASDVHDYGCGKVGSFVGQGLDVIPSPQDTGHPRPDWIITNPPFALAVEFVERALNEAAEGVAMLLRTSWLEGVDRYHRLFRDAPPERVAVFVERVPMTLGRWDPEADTATAYAWFVWRRALPLVELAPFVPSRSWNTGGASLMWIPPGCRQRLERPGDRAQFAVRSAEPGLFDDAPAVEQGSAR